MADLEKEERRPHTPLLERAEGLGRFVDDHNDFALALYGQLLPTAGNLFFSPFSIRMALGMVYAGAKGETAAQMRCTLRLTSSDESLHADFAEIARRLDAVSDEKDEMIVANSLWIHGGAPLQSRFLDLIARNYGGDVNVVDFQRDAVAVRSTINQHVEDKTKGHIREVVPWGALNADTRLVLANAMYFKGMWARQFSKARTSYEPFYLEGGGTVRAPLMHQRGEVRYMHAHGFQAVDLNYRGGDLSMLILLPDKTDALRELETRLSARLFHDCLAIMRVCEIDLFLPRFNATWTAELGTALRALGMPLACSALADFSRINGYAPPHDEALFMSALFHSAAVKVNEEGTEAMAATLAGITHLSIVDDEPPVPVFCADHSFLFAIRERMSGTILFLGRVADPTREEEARNSAGP